MRYSKSIALLFAIAFSTTSFSQSIYQSATVRSAFQKGTRTMTGKPGAAYWQNSGDYNIHVNFSPATNVLSGEETIVYSNNSPDTLKRLIFRLFPDHYKKGVKRLDEIAEKDQNDGVTIDQLSVGNENITSFSNNKKAFHSNTNLIVIPKDKIGRAHV